MRLSFKIAGVLALLVAVPLLMAPTGGIPFRLYIGSLGVNAQPPTAGGVLVGNLGLASGTVAFRTNGVQNADTALIVGSSAANQSFGLEVDAGTGNASEATLSVRNQAGTQHFLDIAGNGNFQQAGQPAAFGTCTGNLGTLGFGVCGGAGITSLIRDTTDATELDFFATGGGAYIGTLNSTTLTLRTNNTDRLIIDGSGNLTMLGTTFSRVATPTGCSGSPPTSTVKTTQIGNLVYGWATGVLCTSNTGAFSLANAIPLSLQPTGVSPQGPASWALEDNGVNVQGCYSINATSIIFSTGPTCAGAFTSSGTKGLSFQLQFFYNLT